MLSKEGRILTVGVVLLLSYLGWIIATYAFSANDANDLLVLTVTNSLFGRAAGISYGFSVGFGDGLIILVNIAIELITVLLVYPLFVFSWKRSLEIRGFKDFFATVKALRVKHSVFFWEVWKIRTLFIRVVPFLDDGSGSGFYHRVSDRYQTLSDDAHRTQRHLFGYSRLDVFYQRALVFAASYQCVCAVYTLGTVYQYCDRF
jgi:hypothetical protein